MSDTQSQIAALNDLWAVYHRYGIRGPNNRQITFEDGDDVEKKRCLRAFLDGTEYYRDKQDKAQRLLLASGFPVPDHWLNLNVGEVGKSWKRDRGTTVSIHSVDENGLDRAAKEIRVAILRLEAGPRNDNPQAMHHPLEITHRVAYAMLDIQDNNITKKEQSKLVAAIRRKAGDTLKCRKNGNHFVYELSSWEAVLKLIGKAGGVKRYITTGPTPEQIEREKKLILRAR